MVNDKNVKKSPKLHPKTRKKESRRKKDKCKKYQKQYQFNKDTLYKDYMRTIGLDLQVDFMGYPINTSKEQCEGIDFHHLRVSQKVANRCLGLINKDSVWNGAILTKVSHNYYHYIERKDPKTALIIKAAMMKISDLLYDPNYYKLNVDEKRRIAIQCFRLIDEILTIFEGKNYNDTVLRGYCIFKRRHFKLPQNENVDNQKESRKNNGNRIKNLKYRPKSMSSKQHYIVNSGSLFYQYQNIIGKPLGVDFMGYSIKPLYDVENKLTYHHLRVSQKISNFWIDYGLPDKYITWNGALLKRTSHDYFHLIEKTDLRVALFVEAYMLGVSDLFIDPDLMKLNDSQKRGIAISNFRLIDETLTAFEEEHKNDRGKGKSLIKGIYTKGRIYKPKK